MRKNESKRNNLFMLTNVINSLNSIQKILAVGQTSSWVMLMSAVL